MTNLEISQEAWRRIKNGRWTDEDIVYAAVCKAAREERRRWLAGLTFWVVLVLGYIVGDALSR